ncbi:MAG TPA: polyphosphate kinase 2 family protein [Planctomycetota bacterium]
MKKKELDALFRVPAGKKIRLKDYDPGWAGTKSLAKLESDELKEKAKELVREDLENLSKAQEVLYASDTWSVLVIFQAMDAAGKDGMIKHVMSGVNPSGCEVSSFKKPSDEELDHNYLWRYARRMPSRGLIGIFNRSYYEEVLVVRVHPEILDVQKLPDGKKGKDIWEERYQDINAFERHLARNGTLILKFFLHVSKKEQKKRFLARLDDSAKHWKFSTADVAERGHWDAYQDAFEDAISATSTDWAPWYVVPADHKWISRAVVAEVITKSIENLDLKFPKMTKERMKGLDEARKLLESE